MARWESVLDDLVRTRRRALVGYAYLLSGDLREAEDLVQDALVKTFRRGRAARDFQLAEAYVRRAILSGFLDARRRSTRWASVSHLFVPDEQAPADDDGPDLTAALACLSPRERACTVLRHYEDLSVAEVAARVGISEGAVKRYLSDARTKLAEALGAPVAEPSDHQHIDVALKGESR